MTPLDSASFAIATPVGPSSGHTIRILAPRLMSAVASLSWVASRPCALSIRYSDEVYPASVKASFRYGASKSTHRVDDVVSGRTTPPWRLLAPLVPAAASDLNWSIVDAMSTVKELMLSPAGTVAEPLDADVDELAEVDVDGVLEDDELLDDEHPAAAKETSAAVSPTQPSPRMPRDLRLPCEWEDRPPSVL